MSILFTLLLLSLGAPGKPAKSSKTSTKGKPVVVSVKIPKYQGVAPPSPKLPSILPKPSSKAMLVWPGFQLRPKKGSRFFFLFTAPITLQATRLQNKRTEYLRLILPNCTAWAKNAWRDLITHFFKTPVERVSFYRHAKRQDMIIDVEYKNKRVEPKISHTRFLGYYLLLLEFPPNIKSGK